MNKEEILKKSRKSKEDEGVEFIENKGFIFGFAIFIIIASLIVVFNEVVGLESYDIFALIFASGSAESITKYKFTHKKRYAISTIFSVILCISCLIAYIDTSLR